VVYVEDFLGKKRLLITDFLQILLT